MPTYEYRCVNGHAFELFQRMSEDPIDRCPECGAQAERLLSAGAGLLFKGSGFYITDYRSDSYRKAAEKDSGSSKSDGAAKSDGATKSDSGPKSDGGSTSGAGAQAGSN